MKNLLMALILTSGGLWGCGSETDDDAYVPPGATTFTLTPNGGTFEGTGELTGVRLVVPADAVDADVELWMAPPEETQPLPATGLFVGPEVVFGPGEPMLNAPAQLTLPFEVTSVMQAGVALQFVKVWRMGPDGWVLEEPAGIPTEDGVSVDVSTLGHYGAGVEIEAE